MCMQNTLNFSFLKFRSLHKWNNLFLLKKNETTKFFWEKNQRIYNLFFFRSKPSFFFIKILNSFFSFSILQLKNVQWFFLQKNQSYKINNKIYTLVSIIYNNHSKVFSGKVCGFKMFIMSKVWSLTPLNYFVMNFRPLVGLMDEH